MAGKGVPGLPPGRTNNPDGRPKEIQGEKSLKFRLSDKLYKAVQAKAKREGISLGEVARQAVAKALRVKD